MLYNERITTDASAGAKVYEGNQGQAIMKQGQEWKQQAAKELEQAKDLERKGYKLGLAKGMNELWADEKLSSNPQALAAEMDKMAESVTANIADKDTKVDVLTDFELKKDSYINQATTKMKRIQEEKARSAAFDAIYANIDSLSRAFGNGVSGNYNDGDVVNYQYSLDRIKANINARNPDGTYMFSDSQRRAMARQADEALRQGFINTYAELPEADREQITKSLNDGTYTVANFGLKDLTGESAFNDIKRDVEKYNRALKQAQIKQREEEGKAAIFDFYDNMSEASLQKAVELNPKMSKNTRENLENALKASPNYDAVTTYKSAEELDSALSDFADSEFNDYDKAVAKAVGIIEKATRSNEKGNVSLGDVETFRTGVMKIMQDENIRRGFEELEQYKRTNWEKAADFLYYSGSLAKSGYEIRKEKANRRIQNLTTEGNSIANGLIMEGRFDEAKAVLGEYRKKIIWAAHPELADKKVGDRVIINGIVHEVTGEETVEPRI